jgi:hypothetical protein
MQRSGQHTLAHQKYTHTIKKGENTGQENKQRKEDEGQERRVIKG